MKPILIFAVLLGLAAPAIASPLFSGTDSADYDVIGVKTYAIQGTSALVMLIQSRYIKSRDYVVVLRSLAPATNRKLIAEVRFHDGDEEREPYAVWLDSCFAQDGTICNDKPPLAEKTSLAKLIEQIQTIYKTHQPS
ncbi:MAG TPA: hypothetical protein VKB51_00410 [bacterium]|nr:hypothetical protein [bacterium]